MNEHDLPEEARKLPTLEIHSDINIKELYEIIEGSRCRRCNGTTIDPDGKYSCLLCRGTGIEKYKDGVIRVCREHRGEELVGIGKRHVSWEDGMGFDHSGFLEVKGCPVCKVPVLSILWG